MARPLDILTIIAILTTLAIFPYASSAQTIATEPDAGTTRAHDVGLTPIERLAANHDDRSYKERIEATRRQIAAAKEEKNHTKVFELYNEAVVLAKQAWIFEPDSSQKFGKLELPMPSNEQFELPQALTDEATHWADQHGLYQKAIHWASRSSYSFGAHSGMLDWEARKRIESLARGAEARGDHAGAAAYHARIAQHLTSEWEKDRTFRTTRRRDRHLFLAISVVVWWFACAIVVRFFGWFPAPSRPLQLGPQILALRRPKREASSGWVLWIALLIGAFSFVLGIVVVGAGLKKGTMEPFVFSLAVIGVASFGASTFYFLGTALSWVFSMLTTTLRTIDPIRSEPYTLMDAVTYIQALNADPPRARELCGAPVSWPYKIDPQAVESTLKTKPVLGRAFLLSWLRDAHPDADLHPPTRDAWREWLGISYPIGGLEFVRWGLRDPDVDDPTGSDLPLRQRREALRTADPDLLLETEQAELEFMSALGFRWKVGEWPFDWYQEINGLSHAVIWGLYVRGELVETFRVDDDGSWISAELDDVSPGGLEQTTLGIAHHSEMDDAQVNAWHQHFAEAELLSPFGQLDRIRFAPNLVGRARESDELPMLENMYDVGLEGDLGSLGFELFAYPDDNGRYVFDDIEYFGPNVTTEAFTQIARVEFEYRAHSPMRRSVLFDRTELYTDVITAIDQ